MAAKDVRLSDLEKEEWWDVAQAVNPAITRQEFEVDWARFLKIKAEKRLS